MSDSDVLPVESVLSRGILDSGTHAGNLVPDGNTVIMPVEGGVSGLGSGGSGALITAGCLVGKYRIQRLLGQGG
ncbi:MAG: hypothetical protein RL215_1365, partial [Planctomycetota bacterium]